VETIWQQVELRTDGACRIMMMIVIVSHLAHFKCYLLDLLMQWSTVMLHTGSDVYLLMTLGDVGWLRVRKRLSLVFERLYV